MGKQKRMTKKTECTINKKDLIPLIDIDRVIADARESAKPFQSLPFIREAWWQNPNRPHLISVLVGLYEYCAKNKIPYFKTVQFINRTMFHLPPFERSKVKAFSDSIGSSTLRSHFKKLYEGKNWDVLFKLNDRFWSLQNKLSPTNTKTGGAIVKNGSVRTYALWDSFHYMCNVPGITDPINALDFIVYGYLKWGKPDLFVPKVVVNRVNSEVLNTTSTEWKQFLNVSKNDPIFGRQVKDEGLTGLLQKIGCNANLRLLDNSIPYGFYISIEHQAQRGSMADVVELSSSGRYRTTNGSIFQGDFYFCKKSKWLSIPITAKNTDKVDTDSWYNPSRYDEVPSLKELMELDPTGTWTQLWDKSTGKPINAQAGKIILR